MQKLITGLGFIVSVGMTAVCGAGLGCMIGRGYPAFDCTMVFAGLCLGAFLMLIFAVSHDAT